jgi:sugar (pentulose or hexulose) kinase
MADAYIVVLDVAESAIRALLFDSEAMRVEGYSAQLPRRADAAADCLDEMHRLVRAAGFRVAAVVGRAESDVTAEDRKVWPAFEGVAWFPALPEGASVVLGIGCVSSEQCALVVGETSMLGTVIERPIDAEGLTCVAIDEKRWLLAGAVPEAGLAYGSLKKAIKGSVEKYLAEAAEGDPLLAPMDVAARKFREIYEKLAGHGAAPQVIGLVKSANLAQRFAEALGAPVTVSTEPEPAGRGAALWALERVGAIDHLRARPASMGAVFEASPTGKLEATP